MATTLTREQRLSLIEAYETEGNNAWDVADTFKAMRPNTYRRALKRVCRDERINLCDVDNPNSQAWEDMHDHTDFWMRLKDVIFDKCDIIYATNGYSLKEDIENA